MIRRPTHQTRLNAFKHHLPHLHIYPLTVFESGSKSLSRTTRTNPIRCALMPSTPMPHCSRFRCLIVRLIFNISASSWRNKTVQGRLNSHHNIYSPWTQVHRSSAPSSAPRLFRAKLMKTTVLLHFKAVAKA